MALVAEACTYSRAKSFAEKAGNALLAGGAAQKHVLSRYTVTKKRFPSGRFRCCVKRVVNWNNKTTAIMLVAADLP
ncbi:hypothetical protein KCP73_08730 [Salmonella enterica subsp. enterica]|nr:hypothetical protein KCP73_08730 [Salmonella enterica subsp. enterica]